MLFLFEENLCYKRRKKEMELMLTKEDMEAVHGAIRLSLIAR